MRLLPDDYLRVRPDMCDTAIVLAGGVHADGSLPREVQGRCAVAVELYSLRVVKRLLCSGGAGDPVKEADAMKRYLIDNGVPAKHIGTETQSRDTIGNAVYSKRMLDEDLVIVVTSEYHVPRAQELFLHVYGPEYDICSLPVLVVRGTRSGAFCVNRQYAPPRGSCLRGLLRVMTPLLSG